MGVEENKRLVARAVAAVVNGGDLDAVDALYAPGIAEAAKEWVAPFRTAFSDVRMGTVEGAAGHRPGVPRRAGGVLVHRPRWPHRGLVGAGGRRRSSSAAARPGL